MCIITMLLKYLISGRFWINKSTIGIGKALGHFGYNILNPDSCHSKILPENDNGG